MTLGLCRNNRGLYIGVRGQVVELGVVLVRRDVEQVVVIVEVTWVATAGLITDEYAKLY
jgi:hypothetical protein